MNLAKKEYLSLFIASLCLSFLLQGCGLSGNYTFMVVNPVNAMQATMSALEYTVANYPTTEVFAQGASAGSVGVYNLAMSFAAENIHLTAVVADSILSPKAH